MRKVPAVLAKPLAAPVASLQTFILQLAFSAKLPLAVVARMKVPALLAK